MRNLPANVVALIQKAPTHQTQNSSKPDSPAIEIYADEMKRLRTALGYIDADGYDDWLAVGMAFYEIGGGSKQMFALWNWWSASSDKYDGSTMSKRWHSFASDRGDKITEATFWHMARAGGYVEPSSGMIFVPDDERKPWPFQSLELVKRLDLPPREPIIGPFISAGVTILAAERGTGKTMFATEIANAVASGEAFCEWECHLPGPVAFVQLDMPIQAVQKRARVNGRFWHKDLHYVTRWHFQRAGMASPNLGDPQHHEAIIAALREYRMVFFDTRRAAQPPGTGAAANLWHPSYWMASLPVRNGLTDAGVSLVFLDHLTAGGEVKDTKSIEDDADTVIALKDSDDGIADLCFQLELTKDRDNVGSVCYFEFDGDSWASRTEQTRHMEAYRMRTELRKTVRETADALGVSERTVKNWTRKAKAEVRAQASGLAESYKSAKSGETT